MNVNACITTLVVYILLVDPQFTYNISNIHGRTCILFHSFTTSLTLCTNLLSATTTTHFNQRYFQLIKKKNVSSYSLRIRCSHPDSPFFVNTRNPEATNHVRCEAYNASRGLAARATSYSRHSARGGSADIAKSTKIVEAMDTSSVDNNTGFYRSNSGGRVRSLHLTSVESPFIQQQPVTGQLGAQPQQKQLSVVRTYFLYWIGIVQKCSCCPAVVCTLVVDSKVSKVMARPILQGRFFNRKVFVTSFFLM